MKAIMEFYINTNDVESHTKLKNSFSNNQQFVISIWKGEEHIQLRKEHLCILSPMPPLPHPVYHCNLICLDRFQFPQNRSRPVLQGSPVVHPGYNSVMHTCNNNTPLIQCFAGV